MTIWLMRRVVLLTLIVMFSLSVSSSIMQFLLGRSAVEVAEEEQSGFYYPAVSICGFVPLDKASKAKFMVKATQTFLAENKK